ncbi:MAG TPA: hypothetical protein VLM89_01905 [Phycisphaerae bacterium]|nr:hypothetical protein [Phycisphaerae bacterium]
MDADWRHRNVYLSDIYGPNCDGRVDFDDINPFVLALTGESPYGVQFPNCDWPNADANRDGGIDFDDINPFVACLIAGERP